MDHPKPTTKTTSTPPVLARRLARALSALADDLVNPYDESTDDFVPFAARLDPSKAFDDGALRAALQVADRYRLDKRELDPHAFDEWGEPYVSSYATLLKVMNATLTDLQVIWARAPGVVRVRVWFVGRMGTEWLVGLRTQSTET
jgi:nuclease A inhibitor-like protein